MADTTQDPINPDTTKAQDDSFEAADAVPAPGGEVEDELDRKPINLDSDIDISQALADADRPKARPAAPEPVPEFADAEVGENNQTPDAPAVSNQEAAELRVQNESLKAQAADANDKYIRTLADLQNFRRRNDEDIHRRIREGNEKMIKEVLPVLDDFDLAVAAAKQAQSYEQLIGGVEAILRKFRETLSRQGIEPIEAIGTPFDPDLHEAVMLDEDTDQADDTVTAELRRGYLMQGRVIRPSLVKVAKRG